MSNMKKPVRRKRTFAVSADEGIFELNVPIDITNPKYKNMLGSVKKPTLHSAGGLLIDPKFKKTPKNRKKDQFKDTGGSPLSLLAFPATSPALYGIKKLSESREGKKSMNDEFFDEIEKKEAGGLLIDPKFKKTPKERKQEKAFGAEPTDLGIPMMGLMGMGMTAASSAAFDKAQKLNKKYKRDKKSKKLTATEGSFQTGGLIKGKPKLAKRGWK